MIDFLRVSECKRNRDLDELGSMNSADSNKRRLTMRNAMMSIVTVVALASAPAWAQIAPVPTEQFPASCVGDLDGNGVVDSADLASMLGSYGTCRRCDEDLNHDGYVDERDVKILANQWGRCAFDESVITEFSRIAADVSDDPEIYEGDVPTNDNRRSDPDQDSGKLAVGLYRQSFAATPDEPEIDASDYDNDDDLLPDRGSDRDELVVEVYRQSFAAAPNEPMIDASDDDTDDLVPDRGPDSGKSLTPEFRQASDTAPTQPEINADDAFSDVEEATCEGDLDRNGQIDSTDLAMLLSKYGGCRGCEEDLNGDGVVNQEDVDTMLDIWGWCREVEEELKHVSRSLAATDENEIEEDLPPQSEPEEEEPQCPGDLDGNGTIDSTDLATLLAGYGRCSDCEADLTGDGYIDRDDVDQMMASWGDCDAEAPSDSSPEGKSRLEILTAG